MIVNASISRVIWHSTTLNASSQNGIWHLPSVSGPSQNGIRHLPSVTPSHTHKIRRNHIVKLLIVFLLGLLASCKPAVPSEYIQEGKMEDILYDYHIALAMAAQKGADPTKTEAYKLAALKKHEVTESQFDASLEYYVRHTERLHKIYERISERLGNEAKSMGASESELAQYSSITSKGDTADVWNGLRTMILSPYAPANKYSFTIKVDTAFHKGDRLMMSFNSQFIVQEGMRDAVVMLAITYRNDSIATQMLRINNDSRQSIMMFNDDSLAIKSVRGYFLMLPDEQPVSTFKMLILTDIRLIRMHVHPGKPEAATDSINKKDPIRTIGGEPVAIPAPEPPEPQKTEETRTPQEAMRERNIPPRIE